MANVDNNCADLEVNEKYEDYTEHLTELMKLQKDIQENVYGYDFSELENAPLKKLREFWDWNYHAIQCRNGKKTINNFDRLHSQKHEQ